MSYYGTSPEYEQVQETLGLGMDARSGRLAALALDGDMPGALKLISAVRDDGLDIKQFCKQTVSYLRALLLAKAGAVEALDLPAEMAVEAKAEASRRESGELVRAMRTFGRADFRDDPQSSLPLELALIEFVSEKAATARPAAEPARAAPAPPPPRTEPQFSIPAAGLDDVASTVASATLGGTADDRPAADEAEQVTAVDGGAELLDKVRALCRESDSGADRQLGALLNGSCEVRNLSDEGVTLGFFHTFHLERIETGPYARRLEELFAEARGRPLSISYEHAPRTGSNRRPARSGHLVEVARELGARPLGEKQNEGGPNG